MAGHRVEEFYRGEGRLMTEHAVVDDNGDGLGTPLEWFQGVRAVKVARDGAKPDGTRAHQMVLVPSEWERSLSAEVKARRNELEVALEELRSRKGEWRQEEYDRRLEELLVEMARLLLGQGGGREGASGSEE